MGSSPISNVRSVLVRSVKPRRSLPGLGNDAHESYAHPVARIPKGSRDESIRSREVPWRSFPFYYPSTLGRSHPMRAFSCIRSDKDKITSLHITLRKTVEARPGLQHLQPWHGHGLDRCEIIKWVFSPSFQIVCGDARRRLGKRGVSKAGLL